MFENVYLKNEYYVDKRVTVIVDGKTPHSIPGSILLSDVSGFVFIHADRGHA